MMSVQAIQIHNLPPQPTPFIGREPEITEIVGLLNEENCRLLTLLGPGGIGKTRLSIECIRRLTDSDFEHGVFYVPLAPLTSADNIVTTVIGVLGIMIGDEGTPQEELVKFLSGRNLLLVMDNFEHVLDGADLVADILNVAPDVKILVTSREALNLRIERVWHVRGMRYPDTDQPHNIDQYSALKLFIDRATWVRRDFSPVDNQACAIRICQLVGGMPLAIELSASWLKTLSCQDIIKQIEHGIDFLTTRARDIPERHRSIRAVFDHSWNLLSVNEQAVFPRLSVFRGGFTLEAAEQVAGANLITLSGLVEKSMVRSDATGRYDVHELLRQYANEKSNAVSEVEETLYAHTSYFADFMREHAIDIKGRRQLEGLNEIESDFENVQIAWLRAIEQADFVTLNHMMEGLVLFCDMRARYQDGDTLFQYAVERLAPNNDSDVHQTWNCLRARWAQVLVLPERNPIAIRELAKPALAVAQELDDLETVALCQWTLGESYRITQSEYAKAIHHYDIGLPLFQKLKADYYVGRILRGMAGSYRNMGKEYHVVLVSINQQFLELTQRIGDKTGTAHAILYKHNILKSEGKFTAVEQILYEAKAIWEEMGDRKSVGVVKGVQGFWLLLDGDFVQAEKLIQESLTRATDTNYLSENWGHMNKLGQLAVFRGNYQKASRLLIEGYRLYEEDRNPSRPEFVMLGIIEWKQGQYSKMRQFLHRYIRWMQESDFDIMNTYLLYDTSLAFVIATLLLAYDRERARAVAVLSLAFACASHTGWMEKWSLLNQLRTDLENELGEKAYQEAWQRGAQLDLDETVAELLVYLGDEDAPDSSTPKPQPLAEPLTERELEVLALIAEGLTNPQIADKLYLSTGIGQSLQNETKNVMLDKKA
jgi:predicted ATPase